MRLLYSPNSRRRLSQAEQHSPSTPVSTGPGYDRDIGSHSRAIASDVSTEEDYEDIGPSLQAEITTGNARQPDAESVSTASSIISTGTKMSYRTLPQPGSREAPSHSTQTHPGPIDIVLGRRNFRITARPGSILSISSFDHAASEYPAPPYEANAPAANSTVTLVQRSIGEERDDEHDDAETPTFVEEVSGVEPLQPTPRRAQHSGLLASTSPESIESSSRSPSPPSPPLSPATTSANAISAHYTNVVRTIDTNHRAEIDRLTAAHAAELSQTRNSIDAAYRLEFQQIRNKSGAQIASLSAQVQELENLLQATLSAITTERTNVTEERTAEGVRLKAEYERKIEQLRAEHTTERDEAVRKARNEVEDLWEARWRDRMRLAGEEVGAAFGERKRVAVCWEEEIKRWWPDQVDEIRGNVEGRLRRERAGERRRSRSGSGSG